MKIVGSFPVSFFLLAGTVSANQAVRDEFVARMDAAMAEKRRDSRLASRLMEMAQPVDTPQAPRFLEQYQDLAINITDYALRYIGCQNVHQYSEELAQDEESSTVLGMNRFVIVRLCPKDKCSNYHHYGCNSGFGDYLIPMEDYLQAMSEEYFTEYQNYCEACYYCMVTKAQQQQQGDDAAAQNNLGDDAVQNDNAGDDNANGDDAANAADGDDAQQNVGDDANNDGRRLSYTSYNSNGNANANDDYYYANADFYNNDDVAANNAQNNEDMCDNYYNACSDFRTACKDYSQYASTMEEYFQCGKFQVGYDFGYLGPHCRSDGKTIGIGLYKDENCNEYNSDLVDLSEAMGMDLGDNNLKAYYSEKCISCNATDGYALEQGDGNEVTAICGALYDMSAKCNIHMGYNEGYESYNQEDTSDEVCTFIQNLITNSYDEYGHIYLDNDWKSYIPDVRSMTKFQKYAMSSSVLLVVGLFTYACYLHRKISTSKYSWYPKGRRGFSPRGLPGQPVSMERMHSGIIQGRSRSGAGPDLYEGAAFA